MKIDRVALFASRSTPECSGALLRVEADLRAAGLEVIGQREDFRPGLADAIVLLGGDGFLMDSVRALGFPATPIFGVNFGSVGFLMNPKASLEGLPAKLRAGRFHIEDHHVLQARLRFADGREETVLAVNDLILERTGGQGVRLGIRVNGVLLNEFSGDGVIISTAAGSTAYNLAAGGPVIHPRVPAIAVTPLYPHRAAPFHSLQFSIVLPLDSAIEVAGREIGKRPIRFAADGQTKEGAEAIEARDSGLVLRLLRVESHEFAATLSRKFIGALPSDGGTGA